MVEFGPGKDLEHLDLHSNFGSPEVQPHRVHTALAPIPL